VVMHRQVSIVSPMRIPLAARRKFGRKATPMHAIEEAGLKRVGHDAEERGASQGQGTAQEYTPL